jgi:hypothetical protein
LNIPSDKKNASSGNMVEIVIYGKRSRGTDTQVCPSALCPQIHHQCLEFNLEVEKIMLKHEL